MGNYEQLKQAISNVVKTNGNQEITGKIMQNALLSIISTVGSNATFAGVAIPTTNPGTPDANVFYMASTIGTYPNFNALKIVDEEIAIFSNNGNVWKKYSINILNKNSLPLYNVDYNNPLSQGYYNETTAIRAVPERIRKIGLIITYKTDETTSVVEQFVGSSIQGWINTKNWVKYNNSGKEIGRFVGYIYKPDYVPDLNTLNVGDYFITDLFDCRLENFENNLGKKIYIYDNDELRTTKLVFNSNGRFDVNKLGKSSLKKETINFVSKRYNINGIDFSAFIGRNRFPYYFSLIYKDAYEEYGITNIYFSSIVIYYDLKLKTIKYKAYSIEFNDGDNSGFSEIDLHNQIIIAILRNKGNISLISEYFTWQYQQSPNDRLTASNFYLSAANEYTCNIDTVEGVLGESCEFRGVIYSNSNPIELTEYQDSYWVLGSRTKGNIVLQNVLYRGTPITIECNDNTVYLISVKSTEAQYSVTEFKKHIGNPFWSSVTFSGYLFLSYGTYIDFGRGSLSYERNIPRGIVGISKEKTKIICIHVNGYESTDSKSLVRAIIKNVSLYNAYPDVRNISSVRIEDCRYELDENSTTGSSYILNFSSEKSGSIIVKNTEFIAHGNVYVFMYINAHTIEINGCTFKAKYVSHPIRINESLGSCYIVGNKIENGKTGIFVGASKLSLIKNVIIESNVVKGVFEESISLDCFGNNLALCPVIAKSYIDTFEVDENERTTTINLKYIYYVEAEGRAYRVSIKDADYFDPSIYLFIICVGEHKYSIFDTIYAEKINYIGESGNKTTYKIKVKGYLPNLKNNDEVGFYSGFFNCVVRNNIIEGAGNNKMAPGHGISLWGGSYCCSIEGNSILGCNTGIQMCGINSFGIYSPSFYNYTLYNTVKNNVIRDCSVMGLKIGAEYVPDGDKYNSIRDAYTTISGNTLINNGKSRIYKTDTLMIVSNIFDRSTIETKQCKNELIENNINI